MIWKWNIFPEKRNKRAYHRGKGCSKEQEIIDYRIDGLENNIQNFNIEISTLLWSFF